MAEANDMDLVREFARANSDAAFTELVRRHINLVYSVARRCTGTDGDAQDVTQAVFIILARKAGSLREKTLLTGWLYETTRFIAARLLRTNARRHAREQEAYMQSTLNEADVDAVWGKLSPHLEAAMSKLSERDRALLVLRFYENKSGPESAALLGIREDAAHKRLARAVEKLRKVFAKRGVTLTATAIAGAISANSLQAAPVGLAKTISAVAVAKGATATASTLTLVKGTLKLMAWSKTQTAVVVGVATVLVATTTTPTVENIFKHLDTDPASADKLEHLSPTFIIRPTQYPTNGVGFQTPDGKSVVVNTSMEEMIRIAYGVSTSARMILPRDLPAGQFDYLNSLADQQKEALRAELKKQFGLVAHTETNSTDALLLKIKDPDKLKFHLVQNGKPGNLGTFKMSRGKQDGAITGFESMQLAELLETIFKQPVVDQTGSGSLYEWKSKSEISPGRKMSKQAFWQNAVDELGLKLVATNMPVEMLVVEKVP